MLMFYSLHFLHCFIPGAHLEFRERVFNCVFQSLAVCVFQSLAVGNLRAEIELMPKLWHFLQNHGFKYVDVRNSNESILYYSGIAELPNRCCGCEW